MCKSTISIAIFNSKLLVYQAGYGGKMVFFCAFPSRFFLGYLQTCIYRENDDEALEFIRDSLEESTLW
jgi:hypothetical protein